MIARLRCRLLGHRFETEREFAYGAVLTVAWCRCGRWGAVVELLGPCRKHGMDEAVYGAPDAVAACRTRAA